MPRSILVVDDQELLRDILKDALQRESYQVFCAASAGEALQIFSRQQIDLIISDDKMSGMTGTELLAIVRKKYPETSPFAPGHGKTIPRYQQGQTRLRRRRHH